MTPDKKLTHLQRFTIIVTYKYLEKIYIQIRLHFWISKERSIKKTGGFFSWLQRPQQPEEPTWRCQGCGKLLGIGWNVDPVADYEKLGWCLACEENRRKLGLIPPTRITIYRSVIIWPREDMAQDFNGMKAVILSNYPNALVDFGPGGYVRVACDDESQIGPVKLIVAEYGYWVEDVLL